MKNTSELRKFKCIRLLWLVPGPLLYLLYRLSFSVPEFVESVYSRAVFRVIAQPLSTLIGLLPFSLGEIVLYAFLIFVLVFVHGVNKRKHSA